MTNIISTSAASLAAAAVRAMPMPVLAASDSVRQYCLPMRDVPGRHVLPRRRRRHLRRALGQRLRSVQHPGRLERAWHHPEPVAAPSLRRRWRVRAKLFYKPGSAGGGGKIEILPRDNDEAMLDLDAVYAPVKHLSVYLAASDKAVEYSLPTKIWHGKTVADLEAMGVKLVAPRGLGYALFSIPAGWSIVESPVSMYQLRLIDDAGNCRAKIFTQPASGSGAEMESAVHRGLIQRLSQQ